ncbi:MAG: DUF4469 domain-containing protein [Tannerella sp.]|jgi:hypothetical protein|nr:DUF4469 domain-containing protein [Tannerella sp.]
MAKIFKVIVELYDLLITARKDDRCGRVVFTGSLKVDDLIAIAVTRRTDINAVTLKASYEILKEIALEEVCNSKQVEFGLTHNSLGVDGSFIGDHAVWDSSKNSLLLHAPATLETRNALKTLAVEVRGMASSGLYVNTLTDVSSGAVNSHLTPGGGVNLTGVKIKITGDEKKVGIFLTEINTSLVTQIPPEAILINDPSKITFITPAALPTGDYKLSITTQFSGSAIPLKEPRTYVFDYVLACK